MPQTNYNLGLNPAQPGALLRAGKRGETIVTRISSAVIPPGVLCELDANGKAIPVQDATTGGSFAPKLIGISYLDVAAVEQAYTTFPVPPSVSGSTFAGYPIGFPVPFVRVGAIWAAWDGNTGTALPRSGAIQVIHSSTGANPQGVFTTRAAQITVGFEIDAAGAYIAVWDPDLISGAYTDSFGNVQNIVALEINLPGHN